MLPRSDFWSPRFSRWVGMVIGAVWVVMVVAVVMVIEVFRMVEVVRKLNVPRTARTIRVID